ncbi:RNA polymerase sigma factor [Salmonirosea aquatica]|uniref:RNA polymerase sigma factor n=1 Tax=Salmonirosea aquatica TaxID=2654236 RepID=UPI00128CCE0C
MATLPQKPGLTQAEDSELWKAFRGGDRVAFGQIYDLYIQELLSYGYRITNDRQLIRDSIQDLFLYLWAQRENLSPTDSIKFYLYRSLRNRILRNTEKSSRLATDVHLIPEHISGDLPFESAWMAEEKQAEQADKLRAAIARLPKRQQEVIQLRYYHDFNAEEIAKLLEINNQSVRNLLHQAIGRLRDFFGEGFFLFALLAGFFQKL